MRVLILGSTGMLGHDCKHVLDQEHEVIAPSKKEMDIISWDAAINTLETTMPDVVVNCAGFNDIDEAEAEDLMVRKINVEGPRNLAQCSARFECKLVHISCDHVFDGVKAMPQPYFEDDSPNPVSAYGRGKMESENAVRENSPNYIIVRTSWLYGLKGHNFVRSVISRARDEGRILKAADDRYGSPTWTFRLAHQICGLIAADARGTYHATSEGYCTRFEWARHIVKHLGLNASVEPCRTDETGITARRPLNCLLENRLLKKQGVSVMRDWRQDLDEFLEQNGETLIEEDSQGK